MSNETSGSIETSKSFTVGKDQLYKAWTEPEHLKQWWKPLDKTLQDVQNDIRPGGRVRYQFDDNLVISGEYKEVAEGERLVYSWNWEVPEESLHRGEYLLHVEFVSEGDGSTLNIRQENFKQEHAIKPHQTGWEDALEDLHNYLANQNG